MKKRVAFRSFVILLAAVMLLSSTSAYNILVYANQDSVANSLSAIGSSSEDAVDEPNIAVQGGTLELNSDSTSTEDDKIPWEGEGTEALPYKITSAEDFMKINDRVNGGTVHNQNQTRYFVLTEDIYLSDWYSANPDRPYITNSGNAYFVTTSSTNSSYSINISGAYTEVVNGETVDKKHKITFLDENGNNTSNIKVDITAHETFAVFDYLNSVSVVSDIIFEGFDIEVKTHNPKAIAVIARQNNGQIVNCEVVDSSVTFKTNSETSGKADNTIYYGVAGAVVDNRFAVSDVKVNNFTIKIDSGLKVYNDYFSGLVAQNQGTVKNSSVSDIQINASIYNHYIGGLVGYNAATITGCSVDMAGESGKTEALISNGGYIGGLAGYNDTGAIIESSSVTGTYNSAQSTSASNNSYNCNLFAQALAGDSTDPMDENNDARSGNSKAAYFGGITSVNKGSVATSTVADLGVYIGDGSISYTNYFGGISGISTGGTISTSVASGTFVAANNANCYAGGIIAWAEAAQKDQTAPRIISDCYALFKISNPHMPLVGAIVGYGGTENTIYNSYWSDSVSGCVTSYVIPDATISAKPEYLEGSLGKLKSKNRAVTVSRNTPVSVSAADLEHEFTKINGAAYEVATVSSVTDVYYGGSITNNHYEKQSYQASITFPTGWHKLASQEEEVYGPLIGSPDKQGMLISFNLDILVTSASGDPDSLTDPLVISSSAMTDFISNVPYGNYKLSTEIAFVSGSWNAIDFTGTIDGSGKTISANTPIFKRVIGSRDVNIYKDDENVTHPDDDTADRSRGFIQNLTVELSGNISSAVFGTVYDATFLEVSLTDSDPTPDDGQADIDDSSSFEGFVAEIDQNYTAAFINSAVGRSYIYGCSTDVSVIMGSKDMAGKVAEVAAFIAYLRGSVYVDNCTVKSVSAYVTALKNNDGSFEKNNNNKAVFLGNVQDNTGGFVLNSVVAARFVSLEENVDIGNNSYLVMGANNGQYAGYYKNITWSKLQYLSSITGSSMTTTDISLWGNKDNKTGTSYENFTNEVTPSSVPSYRIPLPKINHSFINASIADFSVSLVTISNGQESAVAEDGKFTLTNAAVENGELVIGLRVADAWTEETQNGVKEGDTVWVKVVHYETGLLTYVKYTVKIAAFEPADDGYYHIANAEDLVKFSELCNSDTTGTTYLTYAYKLVDNIEMAGVEYTPAATTLPFTGRFTGTGDNGEIYEIRNLTINGTDNNGKPGNVAFIANALSTEEYITITEKSGTVKQVESGIHDVRFVDANITATGESDNAAVVVASAASTGTYGKIKISGIEIIGSKVISAGKNTAAVLASAENCNVDISGVTLNDVALETSYSKQAYFKTDSNMVGGIAGVVASVSENILGQTTSLETVVEKVNINGLSLTGSNGGYALVNAGAIVGSYLRYHKDNYGKPVNKLVIGNSDKSDYDVVINNLTINSAGMAGGAVGATNAQTTISNVKVSSSKENPSLINSTTEYFIGGIAGYIGSYDADVETDTFAINNIYGTISNCLVENTEIKSTNSYVKNHSIPRNVAVGGIAGAINGPKTGNTVENCTVKNCLIQGVVAGGIVGSNIERTVVDGNVIRISGCNVQGTTVTTPADCYSVVADYDAKVASFGVGGIIGTNTYSVDSYAQELLVEKCVVDEDTQIINDIILEEASYSAVGGIAGAVSAYYSDYQIGKKIVLQQNIVSADINATADMGITEFVDYYELDLATGIRIGSGGFIGIYGAFNGNLSYSYLRNLEIEDSFFDGSVTAADCIGGAIGSVINATTYFGEADELDYLPAEPILSDLIISGSLNSTASDVVIRGGVAIGHILYDIDFVLYSGQVAPGIQAYSWDSLEGVFNNIYYSSLEHNTKTFPLFGFLGSDWDSSSWGYYIYPYPTLTEALPTLAMCYIDVNMTEDHAEYQFTDPQNDDSDWENPRALDNIFNGEVNDFGIADGVGEPFTIGGADSSISAPVSSRGMFSLEPVAALGGAQSHWKSSNSSIVAVSDTTYESATVTPKSQSENVVTVSVDYLGVLESEQDSDWSVAVSLPVGFKIYSKAEKILDKIVLDDGSIYELLAEPLDFNYIEPNGKYWLKNDIVFDAEDYKEPDGTFAGGYASKVTASAPFTGEFSSIPDGTYTVVTASGTTYSYSPNYTQEKTMMTVSGLKFKVSSEDTSASALFAYAQNATFKNFRLYNVTSTAAVDYAAAVAAKVYGSVTAENVTVENANISGAKYSGGLFGGFFDGNATANPWNITDCSLVGTRTGSGTDAAYSTTISASSGAAGIVVHTDEKAAVISGATVKGSHITQAQTLMDLDGYDDGAAGISLAYSGKINSSSTKSNTVSNSLITGEIASGAVMRTYTADANGLIDVKLASVAKKAALLSVSDVIVEDTYIKGLINKQLPSGTTNAHVASGGILARAAGFGVEHTISNCSVDNNTVIEAPVSAGGILGCYEESGNNNNIDSSVINVSIDGCAVHGLVKISTTTEYEINSNTIYSNMGVGGIIGSMSRNVGFTGTTVKGCTVDGTIQGVSAVGGIIGAIWSYYSAEDSNYASMQFRNMAEHFIENCVVSADFLNAEGEEAFSANNSATGIVVGHVYDASNDNGYLFKAAEKNIDGFGKLGDSNYPFYNIYFPGYKYPSLNTYLFGMCKSGSKSLNYNGTSYKKYTDYIYDIDFYTQSPISINAEGHYIELSDDYRITQKDSEEKGVWVIDSIGSGVDLDVDSDAFVFNTATAASSTFNFAAGATLREFTLKDVKNQSAPGTTAQLVEVKADTSQVVVVPKTSDDGREIYSLKSNGELKQTIQFNVVFVYSNGLELVAPFRINVSDGDYFFVKNGSATTYYIFNASNLNSTLQVKLNANDRIVQAFDVFWTVEDNTKVGDKEIIEIINSYTAATLGTVYDEATLREISTLSHPNPEFKEDAPAGTPEYLTIFEYLGIDEDEDENKNLEALAKVPLSRLVKDVKETPYGTYRKEGGATLYNFEGGFSGTYTVLTSAGDTGLTSAGAYYAIYGLELQYINTSAQKSDAAYAGLFNSITSGTVTGVTFVNPKIKVVGAQGTDSFAGILAGSVTNSTIENVSVRKLNANDTAYLSNIHWMTAASVTVGGIIGYADSNTVIRGCSVEGMDIVAANLAGNHTQVLKTVMAGGIAGASDGTIESVLDANGTVISKTSVSDCRILVERNSQFRNYYLSYAGGIAARATKSISNVSVSNTVMRDCVCEVNAEKEIYTYSVGANALVADRVGGVVAYTDGSLNISKATVSDIIIRAFDVAGGILAAVEDNSAAVVSVTDCSVSTSLDDEKGIRVYSSANIASASAPRQYYNAAGGIIGKIDNLASVSIISCDFDGYVGTYHYDNLNKDCTAGGIVGFVTDKLGSLDSIKVYGSTVSGTVAGYRTAKIGNMIPYLGAAGGLIGKINSTNNKSNTETMVSDCVMGANVYLYNNVDGTLVDATSNNPDHTNAGKILGTLVASYTVITEGEDGTEKKDDIENFATEEGTNDDELGDFTKYFKNIYVSSYPQDIIAYGSKDFYGYQVSPYKTYTDINRVVNDLTGETENALAVGDVELADDATTADYENTAYSYSAVIPLNSTTAGKATRAFRVNHNVIPVGQNEPIKFSGTASIVAEEDIGSAQIDVNTPTLSTGANGDYHYGVFHISNVDKDIIGDIVLDYSYGLQVNVQFIGMDIKGNGSEQTPYEIATPNHFKVVSILRDKHYKQVADIDLSSHYSYSESVKNPYWADDAGFAPIGNASTPFTGEYDGQGFVIENLNIFRPGSDNVGLFGKTKDAVIKNVHIEIADKLTVYQNENNYEEEKTVYGSVTGKDSVGGLVGYAENTTFINCSVVKGNVIGSNSVGGLVGKATGSSMLSCFTSTTSYAHFDLTSNQNPDQKTAGALVGTVEDLLTVEKSFTLGMAALDPYLNGTFRTNYGSVGGVAGYVDENASVKLNNVFVGASVSESNNAPVDSVAYYGLAVGNSGAYAIVEADNVFVSAPTVVGETYSTDGTCTAVVNPILGSGAKIEENSNVYYDLGLYGDLPGKKEINATAKNFSDIVVSDIINYKDSGINDAYTAAYVELASLEIKVDENENKDTGAAHRTGGLFYPVTVTGVGFELTSSVFDKNGADKYDIYDRPMDTDLYGDGNGNRQTDLLFRNSKGGIKVYLNTFSNEEGLYNDNGNVYDNGEWFYNCKTPYFAITKTAEKSNSENATLQLYRKVVYPVQTRSATNGLGTQTRVYPIATERQLNALSYNELSGKFAAFSLSNNYALVEDITLGEYNFTPISGFEGMFDGKGYTISNLSINSDQSKVGLFDSLYVSTVKDLNLIVKSVTGANYVGGLVGYIDVHSAKYEPSKVVISKCSVISQPGDVGISGENYVGGLVGYANSGIETAGIYHSYTDVAVWGKNIVGGLVGYNQMIVDNCYATGDVNATINRDSETAARGIGGLVGLLAKNPADGVLLVKPAESQITNSFSSSAVDVNVDLQSESPYNTMGNGIGGLVGNVNDGTSISTVFSSGSVRFCYGDGSESDRLPDCVNTRALGIGGLVGVLNSTVTNVYSAASVAVKVGEVNENSVVGIGGVVGVSNASIEAAYSSGSTLGMAATSSEDIVANGYNYGVGGVVGLMSSEVSSAINLYYDKNVSSVSEPIGKYNSSAYRENVEAKTTEDFLNAYMNVDPNTHVGFIGGDFRYTKGAYPYLSNFLDAEAVSLAIRLNALLSIVVVETDERDESAARADGVSMAMKIPTEVEYKDIISGETTYYYYGFDVDEDLNNSGDSDYAKALVDADSKTLSFQRTRNQKQQANFIVNIVKIGKLKTDADGNEYIEYSTSEDGQEYNTIAKRPYAVVAAQMLGSEKYPYLVASQADLTHVAMSPTELDTVKAEENLNKQSFYQHWNTQYDDAGEEQNDKVYYRLMGYFDVDDTYERAFSNLTYGYSFNGNGYSIRKLHSKLVDILDEKSNISNIRFEKVAFESNESLIGVVNGNVEGVNIVGTASGSNIAGLAQKVGTTGVVSGCSTELDYTGSAQSDIAGFALVNEGKIEMSVSAGNITGSNSGAAGQLSNVSAFVGVNKHEIKNSFTLGDIILDNPSGTIAGFAGTNTGNIDACYTRCNVIVTNADTQSKLENGDSKLSIGSFAANNAGKITASFAAGLFDVKSDTKNPADLNSIFVGKNEGELVDVMFDKQLSGSSLLNVFAYAESTADIIGLTNHRNLVASGENEGEYTCATPEKLEYPQLTAILDTEYIAPDISEEEKEALESGDQTQIDAVNKKKAEIALKSAHSAMYRIIRSYSQLSTATAVVNNNNYIDALAVNVLVPLTNNPSFLTWETKATAGQVTLMGSDYQYGTIRAYKPLEEDVRVKVEATALIEDYYNFGEFADDTSSLNLYLTASNGGQNPNFSAGDGTAERPYEISSAAQVVALSYYGKDADNNFKVINDIDMSDADWNAYIEQFKAKLNGNGYTLSNITIPKNTNNSLFGILDGATIENLGVTGINVTTSTNDAAGLLAAKALNNASVTNCVVVGELTKTTEENSGGGHIGGLIGNIEESKNGDSVVGVSIDGCVVSGKITAPSATYVGGLVGYASSFVEETTQTSNRITDCLSTVFVNGGANVGGVIGGGTTAVTNCVFAGNVKGSTVGNIIGESNNITAGNSTNNYYDKQFSTVEGGAIASTTYYLTAGAEQNAFGNNMVWLSDFVGYPVPKKVVTLATSTDDEDKLIHEAYLNAVKLASAKIIFANGVGAGSSTTFTTATPTPITGAVLGVGGMAASGDAPYLEHDGVKWFTNTSTLSLKSDPPSGELTYKLGTYTEDSDESGTTSEKYMTRYVDVQIGKQIKTVKYKITGLKDGEKSILSAITGAGGNASSATAFDEIHEDVLCNDMVFTYDTYEKNSDGQKTEMAQLFRIDAQLPKDYEADSITAVFKDDNTVIYDATQVDVVIGEDGLAYVAVPVSDNVYFNTIEITVNASSTEIWGVRNFFGLFR